MRRRDLIRLIGGAGMAWPLAARAQQPERMRRIGVLMARKPDDPQGQKQFAALRQALLELGWADGKTLDIEPRWTVADAAEALKFAQELIGLKAEVLVANGTPSLVAARQATSTIPIVFVSVADPVGQGFVPSLARPGGNITGFSAEEAGMGGKWLEFLKELAPRVKRIAVIYNPATAPYAPMFSWRRRSRTSHCGPRSRAGRRPNCGAGQLYVRATRANSRAGGKIPVAGNVSARDFYSRWRADCLRN
jgi:ABC transporter substrate binding protein